MPDGAVARGHGLRETLGISLSGKRRLRAEISKWIGFSFFRHEKTPYIVVAGNFAPGRYRTGSDSTRSPRTQGAERPQLFGWHRPLRPFHRAQCRWILHRLRDRALARNRRLF